MFLEAGNGVWAKLAENDDSRKQKGGGREREREREREDLDENIITNVPEIYFRGAGGQLLGSLRLARGKNPFI